MQMPVPQDNSDAMKSLSLSDKSQQSTKEGSLTFTKSVADSTLSLETPCLILCYGSGIGITLVCDDRLTFDCSG